MTTDRTSPVGPDSGLLTPVRAGTRAEEATSDAAWLRALLDAETALVRAQARLGVVPEKAAETIAYVAATHPFDIGDLARRARGAANPVVALVGALTAAVAAEDEAAADHVHRGSTSQDIMDTAALLVARRATDPLLADLDRTTAALARLAATHRDTPMPGRTLALHAVPVTFGLKAAGWLLGVLEAGERLRDVRHRLPVQLGGAAGTLAGYLEHARAGSTPVADRYAGRDPAAYVTELADAFAAETGLAVPVLPWHTARGPLAELAAALALVTGALGKMAVDVQTLSRTEIAEVAEPAAAGRGVSSAMPHKRNPALATLIRAAALQVPALALVVTQAMLAEDERPAGAWHAEWEPLRECLRLAGGAAHTAAELTEGLTPHPARMRDNLDLTGSLLVTERLAAVLASTLGRRKAAQVVTTAATEAARSGTPLRTVLSRSPDLTDHFTEQELTDLLDPTHYTGAAPTLVHRALTHYEAVRHRRG